MKILKPSKNTLAKAVEILNSGGVIICPTDTVYGFLADASNKKAVNNIYKIKNRPRSKPLPVFVRDLKMVKELAEINERQAKILKKFWPGKYTFILKRNLPDARRRISLSDVGRRILYGVAKDTIAIRIPNYKFLNEVLKKVNKPLVQTSVNISAQEPLKNIDEILAIFGKNKLVGLIINTGSIKKAKSSKIIDLTQNRLTRLR